MTVVLLLLLCHYWAVDCRHGIAGDRQSLVFGAGCDDVCIYNSVGNGSSKNSVIKPQSPRVARPPVGGLYSTSHSSLRTHLVPQRRGIFVPLFGFPRRILLPLFGLPLLLMFFGEFFPFLLCLFCSSSFVSFSLFQRVWAAAVRMSYLSYPARHGMALHCLVPLRTALRCGFSGS